jgi:hypothetical protein
MQELLKKQNCKKYWKSPYAHRKKTSLNKKINLQNSKYSNLEKSVNAANNVSIYYAQVNLNS